MNNSFAEVDGKPALVVPEHVNLGLAIDLQARNGTRSLVVASVKAAETMDFAQFLGAYEDIIRRARQGKLTADDFAGTTISLTNPGTIGTEHSVPAAHAGQGHDRRRRRDGVPGGVRRDERGGPRAERGQPHGRRSPRPTTTGSSRARSPASS